MNEDELIDRVLRETKSIAVVGLSDKPHRDSYRVARYLQQVGYRIVPVNPRCSEILGERCYPELAAIPFAVDLVDVFRRGEDTPPVTRAAVAAGAKALWLQLGIRSDESARIAASAGLPLVMDRCLLVEHRARH
jgi:predicted CoA-binding protein